MSSRSRRRPRPWTLALHPVGRRGAVLALAVFLVAFLMRVIGLGHPPGMYFDEVYHARAGAEYLGHKEVFEYTHPPLAKEIIGFAIQHMSGLRHADGWHVAGRRRRIVGHHGHRRSLVWARDDRVVGREIQHVTIDASCRATDPTTIATLDLTADAVAVSTTSVFVAGTSSDGAAQLVRLQGSTERWRATIPGKATQLTTVGDRAFLVTTSGDLVDVSPEGEARTLAVGAGVLAVSGNDKEVWVAFPDDHIIAALRHVREPRLDDRHGRGRDGDRRASSVRARVRRPSATRSSPTTPNATPSTRAIPIGASLIATVPETHVVWAVDGTQVRAIEPHSAAVIGRTTFETAPQRIVAEPVRHGIVGICRSATSSARADVRSSRGGSAAR